MPAAKKGNLKKPPNGVRAMSPAMVPRPLSPGMVPRPLSPVSMMQRGRRPISPMVMVPRTASPLPFGHNPHPGLLAPQPLPMSMTAPGAPQPVIGVHVPLARCRVLYLGSAVPTETAEGLEALQQPLRERFPVHSNVEGIDSWLTVYSNGIAMKTAGDENVTWFPISTLHISAAVKCTVKIANDEQMLSFVPVDSPSAETSSSPPIFAAIMRRTMGVKVLECHSFVTKTNLAAMALVQSCTHAYKHKEAWNDGAPPPAEASKIKQAHLYKAKKIKDNVPAEYFKEPDPHGYFISSNGEKMRKYKIKHGIENDAPEIAPDFGPPGGPGMNPHLPPAPNGYFNDWDDNMVSNSFHGKRYGNKSGKRATIDEEMVKFRIDSPPLEEPMPDYRTSMKAKGSDRIYPDLNGGPKLSRTTSGAYDRHISTKQPPNPSFNGVLPSGSPGYSRKVYPMDNYPRSMREEQRFVNTNYGPDPYDLNYHGGGEFLNNPDYGYHENIAPQGMSGASLHQTLGYLP